jgi:hypothetical protein
MAALSHSIFYALSYAINTQQIAQADVKNTPLSKALNDLALNNGRSVTIFIIKNNKSIETLIIIEV